VSLVARIAAVLLGAAFVLAGASKLAAGDAWRLQARDLGAPRWSVVPLPWIELTIGALLIVQVWRRPMALAALGLLAAFTALILGNLRQGRRPPCACFGAWSARPVGRGHVIRNLVLMALAGAAALI
jgi:uncharacterized membrane protein YphA (DoxX/SURF4 family)